MNDSSHPTILASVLYLRLDSLAEQPDAEQDRLRALLDAVVGRALQPLPLADRLVLDGSDGLVVVVLANPLGALSAAERSLQNSSGLPLAIGIGQGLVEAVAAKGSTAGIGGDGIAIAGAAAASAVPGQLLVTTGFREALAEQAPEREALLRPAGLTVEAAAQQYDLHTPGPRSAVQRRGKVLQLAAGMALLLLVLAGVMRSGAFLKPATLAFEVNPSGKVYVDGEIQGATPPLRKLEVRPGRHRIEVRHTEHPPMLLDVDLKPGQRMVVRHQFAAPGILLFDILPGGEVFVDGIPQGHIPGLEKLELSSTQHRIDVYYESFPPLTVDVNIQPGQQALIRHRFEPEAPPQEAAPDPRKPRGKR
ncbi:MAG TPA: hypothetical protein VLI06_16080 [Solimonas sp.]|nr:hypothetical protein [Solimonas sp.]